MAVPTSFQATELIDKSSHLHQTTLSSQPKLDVAIDGADEIDPLLNCIKGGGGCALQEKIVASCTNNLIIVADHTKVGKCLGSVWKKGVPIEVLPLATVPVQKNLVLAGATTAKLRMAKHKAGPVVTDHGNVIVDAEFDEILGMSLLVIWAIPFVAEFQFF